MLEIYEANAIKHTKKIDFLCVVDSGEEELPITTMIPPTTDMEEVGITTELNVIELGEGGQEVGPPLSKIEYVVDPAPTPVDNTEQHQHQGQEVEPPLSKIEYVVDPVPTKVDNTEQHHQGSLEHQHHEEHEEHGEYHERQDLHHHHEGDHSQNHQEHQNVHHYHQEDDHGHSQDHQEHQDVHFHHHAHHGENHGHSEDHHEDHHGDQHPLITFDAVSENSTGLSATSLGQDQELEDLTYGSNKIAWQVWIANRLLFILKLQFDDLNDLS